MNDSSHITNHRSPITDYPRVAIIILNWNGWKDTIECLESLYQITYPNYDVIVVDNGSKDESIEKIKEYVEGKIKVESKFFEYDPSNKPIRIIEYTREEAEAGGGKEEEIANLPSDRKLTLIKNEKNYGFAEGNNIGMRYALKALNPNYVLLLNNDTVVDKEFLGELVKVGEEDEMVGFAGPKIYYYDFNGRRDVINFAGGKLSMWKGQSCHIGYNKIDKGEYDRTREVDYLEGSCFLIKNKVVNHIGMLDVQYFLYWEETDFCARAHKVGYNIVYVPKAKIWHKIAAASGGTSNTLSAYYMTRNRFLFMKNHASLTQVITFLLYSILFQFWVTCIILGIYYKNIGAIRSFLKGNIEGLKILIKK